jgi:hypothetical protein
MAQSLRIIDVLVFSKANEYRLPQQTNWRVSAVPARAPASVSPPSQPKSVAEFAIGQQFRHRSGNGAVRLQPEIEIEPQSPSDDSPAGSAMIASSRLRHWSL